MVTISPFQGIHYNPHLVGNISKVICPPYDIISPDMQQELYNQHDHNFIRIELGKQYPQDKEAENRYTRAAITLDKWLKEKILIQDNNPALYINEHFFTINGNTYCRRELYCILLLEEWESRMVRPHEGILSKAKSDRLNMLYTLKANTSPIMGLYEDSDDAITKMLASCTTNSPFLNVDLDSGEKHRLWAITDRNIINFIEQNLHNKPIYIADGHHRYESALTYQKEQRLRVSSPRGSEKFDYVLVTLIQFNDPGLVILPAHRMIRGLTLDSIKNMKEGLNTFFNVDIIHLSPGDISQQIDSLLGSNDTTKLVLYGPDKELLYLLTVKDYELVKKMMPYFHTETYQKMDVSILDHVILEELLGLTSDMVSTHVDYIVNISEAVKCIVNEEYQLAIFVNPVKPAVIKAIADAGDRMPRKSTYFYPKIPAGLLVYRF